MIARKKRKEDDRMKLLDRKLLASLIVIGLLALTMGWGTYSWFSDTNLSKNNVLGSGTMDIRLSNDQINWSQNVTSTWSVSNMAPNQTITATLSVTNYGSIGAFWVYHGLSSLTGDSDFADHLFITEFLINVTGTSTGDWSYDMIAWMPTCGAWGTTAPLTLKEFADGYPNGVMCYQDADYNNNGNPSADKILEPYPGNEVKLTMTILFDPNAGNALQGKTCTFELKVGAWNGPPAAFTPMSPSGYGY
jgi:hypothetical protein